jgi:hypothetical protein
MQLSDQQGKAVKSVVNWYKNGEYAEKQSHELAGFAGTGKSTILPTSSTTSGSPERGRIRCTDRQGREGDGDEAPRSGLHCG